jgi:hypothetical protein
MTPPDDQPPEVGGGDRSALNARLRELAVCTPYSHDEWVAAAMYLGDKAEALLPAVEQMVQSGTYSPRAAAMVAEWYGPPTQPRRPA